MAGQFKYIKKVNTTITRGPRKGGTYTRYFYGPGGPRPGTIAGGVAARREKTIRTMEAQKGKLLVQYNRTRDQKVGRKIDSIQVKIDRLNELTRLEVF
jgi:hypothetical protein